MKKNSFKKSSPLALRSALLSALLSGIAMSAGSYFYFSSTRAQALIFGGILVLVTFCITYGVIYYLQFSRLKTLDRINRNIARKQFDDYEHLPLSRRDELDYLIKQSIRASKTVEQEIRRLNRIENYRKEFIGDISHELKTPIFAIQGFIETLLNGGLEDEQINRKFLKKAMRNVSRLIFLTKDLMDISKLETGELRSELQEIPLHKIVEEVIENLQHKAKKEHVSMVSKPINKKLRVRADRNQIKQVLRNLVENAIKYNRRGGSVTVGTRPYEGDEQRLLVYVEDTGIGIEQQYIDRLTERFFRVDKSRSREKGGTGLGLSIVKHIMEAHGEEFFIKSEADVGSTFSFTLTKAEHATAASVS